MKVVAGETLADTDADGLAEGELDDDEEWLLDSDALSELDAEIEVERERDAEEDADDESDDDAEIDADDDNDDDKDDDALLDRELLAL
jgi:hypothetical protein